MKTFLAAFIKDCQGAFAVISAIVIVLILGIVSFVISVSMAVVDRNSLQASADLAVISARVEYRRQLQNGEAEATAYDLANKAMKTIFASNRGQSSTVGGEPIMTKGSDGFSIDQAGNSEIYFNGGLTGDTKLSYSVISRAFDAAVIATTTGNTNTTTKTAVEVSVVIDTSSSMGYSFLNSGDWIYESIATGAISAIEQIFQGDVQRDDTAVGVIHFHDNVVVNQPLVNNSVTATNAVIWPWHGGYAGATNIYLALQAATKQIEDYTDFDNQDYDVIKEVIVLLSDGMQSTKFGIPFAQVEQLCTDFKAGGDAKRQRYIYGMFAKNAKFGSEPGTVDGVKFVKDCSSGGGYHYNVDNKNNTAGAYNSIAAKIIKHKKQKPTVTTQTYDGVRLTK